MTATTLAPPRRPLHRLRRLRLPGWLRSGYGFFLAMAAIVGLHVADDSFIQPNPGTSAGDHLASGLVPLAALALAALAYPRVRGGYRATLAILVGISGIVVGIEALHYTKHVGPSDDDFSGLLAVPAGVALLGFGIVTAWRTRRRHGGLLRRGLRRSAIALASVIGALFVVFPLGYSYVATHAARPPVEDIDLGTANVEDVQLQTSDGLSLEGSYVPSRNGAAVIVAFGRKGSQRPARMLARHGYGVLIFDRRGEGESDGDPNPYAWDEGERDITAAVEFLKDRPDVEPGRIGGIGLSVGGETFLQAAARSEDIKAVVSEGATARSYGELASVEGSAAGPLAINAVMTAGTAVFSDATPPEHLIDQVDEIAPRAMFLIHAPKADPDEKRFNEAFYRAAGGPKEIWGVPEAGHVGAQEARPREYEQRVTRFFGEALLDEGSR
jgi:uncharacterized protein